MKVAEQHALPLGVGVFLVYVACVVFLIAEGYRYVAAGQLPLVTDFTSQYGAALLLRQDAPESVFHAKKMYEANVQAIQSQHDFRLNAAQARSVGISPWMYPPIFFFFCWPLAWLSYLSAYVAWMLATAVPYLAAMRLIVQTRWAWFVALAAPPTFFNLHYGQTGFLTAGLIGVGLALLTRMPTLAGICIGLAAVKPHFGVLIPLALVLGGHWKPFGVATITVVSLIVGSIVVFGADPWYGYIGTMDFYLRQFETAAYRYEVMVTPLAAARLAGMSGENAWTMFWLLAIAAVGMVVWAWLPRCANRATLALQSAILCIGTFLVIPMAYAYDLTLLVPAIAWLWQDMKEHGCRKWEMVTLGVGFVGLFPVRWLALASPIQLTSLLLIVLMGLAAYRLHVARQVEQINTTEKSARAIRRRRELNGE